ncbi:MAG TPA: hypothetical protein VFD32_08045 [Dehalococcoidia bacterium]|nr:hypothetical protein [Dehalococcoidia bacterium]
MAEAPQAPYQVVLAFEVFDDFERMRSTHKAAIARIRSLALRPDRGHPLTGSLRGCRSPEISHDKAGAHRAVYFVDQQRRQIVVLAVGTHEYAYAQAAARAERYR